jgi:hypothetical protein
MMLRLDGISLHVDRAAELAYSLIKALLLQAQYAKLIERAEMPLVCFKHAPVRLFCLPQAILLMERRRMLKRLLKTVRLSLTRRKGRIAHALLPILEAGGWNFAFSAHIIGRKQSSAAKSRPAAENLCLNSNNNTVKSTVLKPPVPQP